MLCLLSSENGITSNIEFVKSCKSLNFNIEKLWHDQSYAILKKNNLPTMMNIYNKTTD